MTREMAHTKLVEAATVLVDQEIQREKEEARGLVRRDGGRSMNILAFAEAAVEVLANLGNMGDEDIRSLKAERDSMRAALGVLENVERRLVTVCVSATEGGLTVTYPRDTDTREVVDALVAYIRGRS